MLRVLRAEHNLSDHFLGYLLARNILLEKDLLDLECD
jgi:hypothetical protein